MKNTNGVWVTNDVGIANEAVSYFLELFSGVTGMSVEMLHLIPTLVMGEENEALEACPSMEVVK